VPLLSSREWQEYNKAELLLPMQVFELSARGGGRFFDQNVSKQPMSITDDGCHCKATHSLCAPFPYVSSIE